MADTTRNGERQELVAKTIEKRGISDPEVLRAIRAVHRHRFVPEDYRGLAYADRPLPIGHEQTISQPYIVALMTELAGVDSSSRVLEIGTGSGYQAAVLAEIVDSVYSIEILFPLAERAKAILDTLGYDNIEIKCGDGFRGWPEHAPFDAILVTAAPEEIPEPLIEQLKEGGKLVIPVGSVYQELKTVTKTEEGVLTEDVIPVRFVPMTGEAQDR
ncbi:MAG: protein-L-isoaspartate(D-aspartate) O-methyltransferase [bacterium]